MLVESLNQQHSSAAAGHHDVRHDNHEHGDVDAKAVFGFWIYIMSDCILFACLFATFAVLHDSTYGGPNARELFSMPFVLIETVILLTSSFTYGLAMLGVHKRNKAQVLFWLFITFLLGISFVTMELWEFSHLFHEGNSWQRSAFLSSFFTLVGTHGMHVTVGLVWMLFLMIQVAVTGFTPLNLRKLVTLSLFWHFLDIVWVFVFSIVYLLGVM